MSAFCPESCDEGSFKVLFFIIIIIYFVTELKVQKNLHQIKLRVPKVKCRMSG